MFDLLSQNKKLSSFNYVELASIIILNKTKYTSMHFNVMFDFDIF